MWALEDSTGQFVSNLLDKIISLVIMGNSCLLATEVAAG
jgi:hypothetical protein